MPQDYYSLVRTGSEDKSELAILECESLNFYAAKKVNLYCNYAKVPTTALPIMSERQVGKTAVEIGDPHTSGAAYEVDDSIFDLDAAFNRLKSAGVVEPRPGPHRATLRPEMITSVDTYTDRLNTAIERAYTSFMREEQNSIIVDANSKTFTYAANPDNTTDDSEISTSPTAGYAFAPLAPVMINCQLKLKASTIGRMFQMKVTYAVDNQGTIDTNITSERVYQICSVGPLAADKTITISNMSSNLPHLVSDDSERHMQPVSDWDTQEMSFVTKVEIYEDFFQDTNPGTNIVECKIEFVLGATTISHVTNKEAGPKVLMRYKPSVSLMLTPAGLRKYGVRTDGGFWARLNLKFDTNTNVRLGCNVDRNGHVVPHPISNISKSTDNASIFASIEPDTTYFDALGSYLYDLLSVDVVARFGIPSEGRMFGQQGSRVLLSIKPSFAETNSYEKVAIMRAVQGDPNHVQILRDRLEKGGTMTFAIEARYKQWPGEQQDKHPIVIGYGDTVELGITVVHPDEDAATSKTASTPYTQKQANQTAPFGQAQNPRTIKRTTTRPFGNETVGKATLDPQAYQGY